MFLLRSLFRTIKFSRWKSTQNSNSGHFYRQSASANCLSPPTINLVNFPTAPRQSWKRFTRWCLNTQYVTVTVQPSCQPQYTQYKDSVQIGQFTLHSDHNLQKNDSTHNFTLSRSVYTISYDIYITDPQSTSMEHWTAACSDSRYVNGAS